MFSKRLGSSRSERISGFTLVELLVVIAIIGILIALLLPAVQAAREAARRTECINNVKQVCLGLQNHHDVYKRLPLGAQWLGTGAPNADGRDANWGATWVVRILPYIEQDALYDQYNLTLPARNSLNTPVTRTRLPNFVCPSSGFAQFTLFLTQSGGQFAKGNYAANFGAEDGMSIADYDDAGGGLYRGAFTAVGLKEVQYNDILDGLSKTLAVSEILGVDVEDDGRGAWAHVVGPMFTGNRFFFCNPSNNRCQNNGPTNETYLPNAKDPAIDHPAHCGGVSATRFCTDDQGPNAGMAARSRHPGGVVAGLCDGSTRFVSNSISPIVWTDAFTIKGTAEGTGVLP